MLRQIPRREESYPKDGSTFVERGLGVTNMALVLLPFGSCPREVTDLQGVQKRQAEA